MRILLTSDWHADKSTLGVDRFDEIRRAAFQTVDAAITEDVDLFAFLGDLSDPTDALRALRALELAIECERRLTLSGVKSIWIAGNHDVGEAGDGRTTISPMRALVRDDWPWVAESPGVRQIADGGSMVAVMALPYSAASTPYCMRGFVEEAIGPDAIQRGIVLGHATYIPGAVEGEETIEMPRGRAVPFPIDLVPPGWTMANGHFHTPQVTPGGVIIPGALARLTRGERSNDPRFVIVEI